MSYADGLKSPKHNSPTTFKAADQNQTTGPGVRRPPVTDSLTAKKRPGRRRRMG